MKEEIAAAVLFISKLIQRGGHMPECYLGGFQQRLGQLLELRFSNHWHPERPWRGQAYRCLRVNETQRCEPTIEQAAKDCGLLYTDLKLPVELTIWVDPEEVCCRFGEAKGSCCVVASFKEGNKENFIENFDFSSLVRPTASPSPTPKSGDILQDKTGECVNTSKVAMTVTTNSDIMANDDTPLSTESPTSPSSTSTSSPPSSTQSTPTKRKAFSPHNKTSPNHNKVHHNNNNKRNFGNIHHHNGYNNHHPHHHHHHHHPPPHHHSNGSYSPPYYKSNHQSWVNLSQTPPPPPPPHVPLFSSGSGFIYPPAAPPHYTAPGAPHNAPHHFTRSPPNVGPQKLKWNAGSSYPRQDRHPWFSHRALARV